MVGVIKVEISEKDGALSIRNPVSKETGEVLTFREQIIYIYNGGAHPVKSKISLDKDISPYPAGFYTFSEDSYGVGNYDKPCIKDRFKLVPYPSNQK